MKRLPPLLRTAPILLTTVALLCGCAQQQEDRAGIRKPTGSVAVPARMAVETFDAVWNIVADTYWDTNYGGVDWVGARDELRPRAQAAATHGELLDLLDTLLSRLGQSHMRILVSSDASPTDKRDGGGRQGSAMTVTSGSGRREADSKAGSPRTEAGTVHRNAIKQSESRHGPEPSKPVGSGGELEGHVPGTVGMEIRLIEREFVVVRVEEGSAAEEAGVRSGWLLARIEGVSLSELTGELGSEPNSAMDRVDAWAAADGMLRGRVGTHCLCEFVDARDGLVSLSLERRPARGQVVKLGNLPPLVSRAEWGRRSTGRGGQVGWIRFNVWMLPLAVELDAAVDALRDTDGLVLDLRGNLGGMALMTIGFAGHFLADDQSLGTMKMRDTELEFRANPRRATLQGRPVQPFAGPIAVLVDGITASTSEMFAGGLQALGRARVFGEPTAGQVLPATIDRLPNGDQLLHAVADFLTPNGIRLEGRGVVPDQCEPMTRRSLLEGRDPAFDAAVDWIAYQSARDHDPNHAPTP